MKEAGDEHGKAKILNNLSKIYQATGDLKKALTVLKESLVIMHEVGHESDEGASLNDISQIYFALGDLETTRNYLNLSLMKMQDASDNRGLFSVLMNFAELFVKEEEFDTAYVYYESAREISTELGDEKLLELVKGKFSDLRNLRF